MIGELVGGHELILEDVREEHQAKMSDGGLSFAQIVMKAIGDQRQEVRDAQGLHVEVLFGIGEDHFQIVANVRRVEQEHQPVDEAHQTRLHTTMGHAFCTKATRNLQNNSEGGEDKTAEGFIQCGRSAASTCACGGEPCGRRSDHVPVTSSPH